MNDIWPRVNQALCEAWGLNPNEVKSIDIIFRPHQIPYAEVTLNLNEEVMHITMQLRLGKDVQDD